jgi:predicted transcriptional regulator
MRVLLSIRPEHVENILNGRKTFEFRRKLFTRRDVNTVVIYSTKPVGRIVAEFDIDHIIEEEPEALWRQTSKGSGITKRYFDEYFFGRPKGYAIGIGEVRIFDEPIDPKVAYQGFTPPQSFMYVPGLKDALQPVLL